MGKWLISLFVAFVVASADANRIPRFHPEEPLEEAPVSPKIGHAFVNYAPEHQDASRKKLIRPLFSPNPTSQQFPNPMYQPQVPHRSKYFASSQHISPIFPPVYDPPASDADQQQLSINDLTTMEALQDQQQSPTNTSPEFDEITPTPDIEASSPPPEFNCSEKAIGIYVRKCSSKFHICMHGISKTLNCPTGKVYSASAEKCEYRNLVKECDKIPSSSPSLPVQTTAQTEHVSVCNGLINGIYGRRCSQTFYACTDQQTVNFTCPAGQAFNVKTVRCEPKIDIQTCPEYKAPQPPSRPPKIVVQEASTTREPQDEQHTSA